MSATTLDDYLSSLSDLKVGEICRIVFCFDLDMSGSYMVAMLKNLVESCCYYQCRILEVENEEMLKGRGAIGSQGLMVDDELIPNKRLSKCIISFQKINPP